MSYYTKVKIPNLEKGEAGVKIKATGDYVAVSYLIEPEPSADGHSTGQAIVKGYARWVDSQGKQQTFVDGSPVKAIYPRRFVSAPFDIKGVLQVLLGDPDNSLGVDVSEVRGVDNAIASAKAMQADTSDPSTVL